MSAKTYGMCENQKNVFEENIRYIMEELDATVQESNIYKQLNQMSQEKAHTVDLMLTKAQLGVELTIEEYKILEKH